MSPNLHQNEKIDQKLLPYLNKLILEEYHYLSPSNRSAQKHTFLNTAQVNFHYNELDSINLEVYEEELRLMRKKTKRSDVPETVKSLYEAKFSEQQKILNVLEASKSTDDAGFHRASCDLYGQPEPDLLWLTVTQIHSRFSSLIKKIDPKRKTLQLAFSVWQEYYSKLKKPDQLRVHHIPFCPGFYFSDDTEINSSEKIYKKFLRYLDYNNINNWSAKIDLPGARTSFGVDQANKVINIPHDSDLILRKDILTKVTLKALLMHEIGVHVTRRENGDQSPLALLGIGLDNYLRAEEGIATVAEQLITGTKQYAGYEGYFSVGAAMGILNKPLDFNELFTLLNAYFILHIANEQLEEQGFYELDELRLIASDKAWNRALRTYRGSTGQKPGAVYTRDIIYLEGNMRIWKILASASSIPPEWLIGKYDPANTTHVAALKDLGILQ